MSQMTATAPRYIPSTRRGRAVGVPQRTPLRVVRAAPMPVRHAWFAVGLGALILSGLMLMLMLNIARAEGSFTLSDLRADHAALEAEQVALASEVADLSSPSTLSRKAGKLGMVDSPSTATLRLSDNQVFGVAALVEGGKTFTVDLPGATSADGSQPAGE